MIRLSSLDVSQSQTHACILISFGPCFWFVPLCSCFLCTMIFHVSLDDFRPSLVFVLRLDIMHCHPPTAQCALDVACTGRAVVPSMEGLPNMVITGNKFPDFCKVKFGAPEEVPKIPKSIPKSSSNLLFLKAMVRLQESLGKWIWTYYVHFSGVLFRGSITRTKNWPPVKKENHSAYCETLVYASTRLKKSNTHNQLWNYMEASKNRDTPKWMVYNGKPYFQMDDLGVPLFLETSIYRKPVNGPSKSKVESFLKKPCHFLNQPKNSQAKSNVTQKCLQAVQFPRGSGWLSLLEKNTHTKKNTVSPITFPEFLIIFPHFWFFSHDLPWVSHHFPHRFWGFHHFPWVSHHFRTDLPHILFPNGPVHRPLDSSLTGSMEKNNRVTVDPSHWFIAMQNVTFLPIETRKAKCRISLDFRLWNKKTFSHPNRKCQGLQGLPFSDKRPMI